MAKREIKMDALPNRSLTSPPANHEVSEPQPLAFKGNVKVQKQSGLAVQTKKITNALFETVIVPALKDLLTTFVQNGLNMALFGENSPGQSRGYSGYQTNYVRQRPIQQSGYGHHQVTNLQRTQSSGPPAHQVLDIYWDDKHDANMAMSRLMETLAMYNWCSVGDLYHACGVTAPDHTHEVWGWDDLSTARVIYTSKGYMLDLPRPRYSN